MSDLDTASISELNPVFRFKQADILRAQVFLPDLLLQTVVTGDSSPVFTEAPTSPDRGYVSADGLTYFVPRASIATSRVSDRPTIAIAKRDGAHLITLQVVLRRHADIPAEATLLTTSGWQVAIVGASLRYDFTVAELPLGEGEEPDVVRRLACEVAVDPNQALTLLQRDETARLSVTADVAYRIAAPPSSGGGSSPFIPDLQLQVLPTRFDPTLLIQPPPLEIAAEIDQPAARQLSPKLLRRRAALDARVVEGLAGQVAGEATVAEPTSHTARPELSSDQAHFPPENAANRGIYAAVSSSFGSNPIAAWVDTPAGEFVETPVLEQYYVLPDEYRLAFDLERSAPAMSVLLVPKEATAPAPDPAAPAAPAAPVTFGRSYSVRVAFSIVPWVSPSRLAELRRIISQQTGTPYPQLVVGGIGSATFALSSYFHDIGGTLVGGSGDTVTVDPDGFELVLDCTSEFYATIAAQLVDNGFSGQVDLALLGAGGVDGTEGAPVRTVTRQAQLRLDRPDTSFLTQRLEALDDDPATPMQVAVANPSAVPVSVGGVLPTVLAYDANVAAPVKAGTASAAPTSFAIAAGAEQVLTIGDTGDVPWGGVLLDLEQVSVTLDAQQVLGRAQDLGSVSGLKTQVHLVCYQLQHPDVLPPSMADVHGLQVELRRTEATDPVTVFLTRDQPDSTVDVAFTLSEVLAGASPEQPKFSWRRRNMAGAGNGPWSEWESIVGRELFVTPLDPAAAGGA